VRPKITGLAITGLAITGLPAGNRKALVPARTVRRKTVGHGHGACGGNLPPSPASAQCRLIETLTSAGATTLGSTVCALAHGDA
jgi:hypothetical protein